MEQIIVYSRLGVLRLRMNAYGRGRGIDSAEQIKEKMGQDVVKINFISAESVSFEVGDYIDVFGDRYFLYNPPSKQEKNSENNFSYDLEFQGKLYQLGNVIILNFDSLSFSTGGTFSLMGNLNDFAQLIIRNLNRVEPELWVLGDVFTEVVEHQLLGFADNNCLQVLQDLCAKYQTEFYIIRNIDGTYKLNIAPKSNILFNEFKYGRAKGLTRLSREYVSGKPFFTRLYAYGSTKNIPLNYRSGSLRLKLPLYIIPEEGQPYIQDDFAIFRYGIRETSMTYEDIFPSYIGTVSAITSSPLIFHDSIFPFNLMESSGGTSTYLLPGTTAKIVFKSGDLNGYEFEVERYTHTDRRFKIKTFTDESGTSFPDAAVLARTIKVGDTYTIYDISLPDSYIVDAENRLHTRAIEELNKMVLEPIKYKISIDPLFIQSMETEVSGIINYFDIGDRVKIKDTDLGLNGTIPVQSFTRDLLNHYVYDITLGELDVNLKRSRYLGRLTLDNVVKVNIDSIIRPSRRSSGSTTISSTTISSTIYRHTVEEDTGILYVDGIFYGDTLAFIEIDGVAVDIVTNSIEIAGDGGIDFSSVAGGLISGQNITIGKR